jgi:hypothetical protein
MSRSIVAFCGFLLAVSSGVASAEPRELTWDDLLPFDPNTFLPPAMPQKGPEAYEPLDDGGEFDDSFFLESPAYPTGVVESLDGQEVRLPGFIVPLDLDSAGNIREFFLVPYMGACVHLPPPPPNQIVFVVPDENFPLDSMWEPFWIEGTMNTEQHTSDVGIAGYTIHATKIEVFEGW